MFVIRQGKYTLPNGKKIDTSKELSNEQLLELYELRKGVFPFITITKKAVSFLKKQKLSAKRVSKLILKATTTQEVNLLLEVNNTKAIKTIAETKITSLESK